MDGSGRPELRIDGYLGEEMVASRRFSSDPAGDVLALAADHPEIVADGADATRLEFRAVDCHGAPRPYISGQVTLEVEGPAALVGDNPFDFAAAGGAGAVWIRSRPGEPGPVTVRASHPGLGRAHCPPILMPSVGLGCAHRPPIRRPPVGLGRAHRPPP